MADNTVDGGNNEDKKLDFNLKLVAESSFATLFPKYREKYVKECFPLLVNHLQSIHGIRASLDVMEGSLTVFTTRQTKDPYAIMQARDVIKLIARGVPYQQAIKVIDNEDTACDVIKIGRLVRNRDRFVRRRQRLVGPSGATLKAVELLTDCYVLIQGNTASAIGPYKGLAAVRKVVTDCLVKNVHPVFNIKRLLIQRELAKDPTLADQSWERFLPKLPKTKPTASEQNKQKKKKKIDKEYTPFPPEAPMSKVDQQLASGEYFLKNSHDKSDPNEVSKKRFNSKTSASAKGKERGPRPKFGGGKKDHLNDSNKKFGGKPGKRAGRD